MCQACFSDHKLSTSTTFTVNYQNCIIVVKNVPCLECPFCGEEILTDEVSERLEQIVSKAKDILQDISVIDYARVA